MYAHVMRNMHSSAPGFADVVLTYCADDPFDGRFWLTAPVSEETRCSSRLCTSSGQKPQLSAPAARRAALSGRYSEAVVPSSTAATSANDALAAVIACNMFLFKGMLVGHRWLGVLLELHTGAQGVKSSCALFQGLPRGQPSRSRHPDAAAADPWLQVLCRLPRPVRC